MRGVRGARLPPHRPRTDHRHRPRSLPALLWLEATEWAAGDLDSLQLLQVGGSRLQPETARRITPALGCRLQQVFGMAN
ncbi:hypothetical protein [Streptomyces sp. NPDC058773]|uniref:hypothetical protein n=1 Tax=Streptomyces sp. NPDC058773 TaxID=3346632 RepID=UPI0036C9A0A5